MKKIIDDYSIFLKKIEMKKIRQNSISNNILLHDSRDLVLKIKNKLAKLDKPKLSIFPTSWFRRILFYLKKRKLFKMLSKSEHYYKFFKKIAYEENKKNKTLPKEENFLSQDYKKMIEIQIDKLQIFSSNYFNSESDEIDISSVSKNFKELNNLINKPYTKPEDIKYISRKKAFIIGIKENFVKMCFNKCKEVTITSFVEDKNLDSIFLSYHYKIINIHSVFDSIINTNINPFILRKISLLSNLKKSLSEKTLPNEVKVSKESIFKSFYNALVHLTEIRPISLDFVKSFVQDNKANNGNAGFSLKEMSFFNKNREELVQSKRIPLRMS